MKVCLVSFEYPPQVGGEATYTRNLATGLARLGHEVRVVVPDRWHGSGPAEDGLVRKEAVRVASLPLLKVGSFMLAADRYLRRLVSERAADIIHFTFDYPSLPLRLSGLGAPTVATVHHLHQVEALSALRVRGASAATIATFGRSIFTTLMERTLVADASSIVAVSAFTGACLSKYAGVGSDRVTVIPNGIDATPFVSSTDTGSLRAKLGLGTRPLVLCVGRQEPSKGLEYLVHAFKKAKEGAPNACLLMVGAGSRGYLARLRRTVASLGIEGDVIFAGRVSQQNLYEAYAASSVVVLPSLMEGFGITLVEAMAAAKPCIGTNVGAIPGLLLPARTGLLVNAADTSALAAAMQRVLTNPEEAKAMGERGRALVKSNFTVGEMVRRTEALYRATVEEPTA